MKQISQLFSRCLLVLCFVFVFQTIAPSNLYQNIPTIEAKENKITCNAKKKSFVKGQFFTFKLYHMKKGDTVSFHIKNTKIASISRTTSKSCKIKAVAVGSTRLTATVYRNDEKLKVFKCTLRVTPAAVSVHFRTSELVMQPNDTINLMEYLNLKPKHTAEIPTFTISDTDLLSLHDKTNVTALATGTVTVTATIRNGKSDTISIVIEDN